MNKLLFALLLLCFGVSAAQAPGTGNYPFASFDTPGFDSVNLGNLDVRFSIPIVSRPGRGVPFQYALQYEGLVWSTGPDGFGNKTWVPDPEWGLHGLLNGTGLTGYLTHSTGIRRDCPRSDGNIFVQPPPRYLNYVYHDQFGVAHPFDYEYRVRCGDDDFDTHTGSGLTADNSGYSLNVDDPFQVVMRSGTQIYPPLSVSGQDYTSLFDTNGNYIDGSSAGIFTDTLGANALTISGGSPRVFTYPVTLQANGATTAQTTLSYRTYTVRTNFQCSDIVDYGSNSVSLPDRVTFADGTYYAFTYERTPGASDGAVTGRLASITLPTGGVIQYGYSGGCSGAGINADGTAGSLTRTTSDGTRQYLRSPSSVSTSTYTLLVDEKSNETRYAFVIDPNSQRFYETHREIYQGGTNGVNLLNQYTCNNGTPAACDNTPITMPISQRGIVASYNGGQQTFTAEAYDANGSLLTNSKLISGGALLKELRNNYNDQGALIGTTQLDPNGTTYASTTYVYDEGAPVGTSGIPRHGSQTGPRGNLTSTHISAGSSTLSTSTTYFDTGQPKTSTAVDGGVTNYNYDAAQGFVTSTNLPTPSSGVALTTGALHDLTSAAFLVGGGVNPGENVTINQYDSRMRPIDINLPSGSHITFPYYDANHTLLQQTLDGSRSSMTETLLDGYGRLSRTTRYNGQSGNGWYQVDYCYDATGMLRFQSTAYQSTGLKDGDGNDTAKHCSGSGTAYEYDALGRVTKTTTDDGTSSTTYLNRAVKTVDVNNIGRITQYDLQGRIGSVCELSSTNYAGQSPTACGMDIAGTGYLTTYSYDLAQHQTTINQGGQTRTFQTDAAGRLSSVSEPERGTTGYAYAYNSTGLQVTRTRAKANQTNPNVKTNTVTQYDLLGRVVSVNYDDGTPKKEFFYDTKPGWMTWSASPSYVLGRLAGTFGGYNTQSLYSYDLAGNVTDLWQCAPSTCGNSKQESRPALHYTYDLSGAVLSAYDAASGNIVYGRTAAGEITSVTNQTYNAGGTPNLVSNVVNGQFGPKTYSLANGLSTVNNIDPLGRNAGGWICAGSSAAYCQSGSQVYGNLENWRGQRVLDVCDTVFNPACSIASYDDLNRLTAYGSTQSYSYDRWGNRTGANGVGYSFNPANNQQANNGYDAAGNQLTDSSHSYTYDAEGKVVRVDGGTTAGYVYDALDQRVRVSTSSSDEEYLFDPFGRRQSSWNVSSNAGTEGRIYWDHGLLANRSLDGRTYFHHTNYLGTERVRTDDQGQLASAKPSGPYGENTPGVYDSGANQDNANYTGQDHDNETGTDHFLYRQYSEQSGRWMSPDPSDESYDGGDPQTANRYVYAKNNPLSYVDPDGLYTYGYDCPGNCVGAWTDGDGWGGTSGGATGISITYGNGYPTSGGGSGGAGGGGAPIGSNPRPAQKAANVFVCASNFGTKLSIANGLSKLGIGTSAVGGFISSALGGNTFSSITDLVTSFGPSKTGGGQNMLYNMGQSVVSGPLQGLPVPKRIQGTPWASSATGLASDAIATGIHAGISAGGELTTLAGTVSTVGLTGAEFASGVGQFKLIYDGVTYAAGLAGCAAGVIR